MSDRVAKRLKIKGKVQGVWYRAWFEREAEAIGISGFVRNRLDGSVEALVVGSSDQIEEIVRKSYEGSPASEVTGVDAEAAQGFVPNRFEIKPTV